MLSVSARAGGSNQFFRPVGFHPIYRLSCTAEQILAKDDPRSLIATIEQLFHEFGRILSATVGTRIGCSEVGEDIPQESAFTVRYELFPLGDVLKLTTGPIVKLDHRLNEPVDVIVNRCLVARGEVGVVDGNRIPHRGSQLCGGRVPYESDWSYGSPAWRRTLPAQLACGHNVKPAPYVVSLVSLVLGAVAGKLSWSEWQKLGRAYTLSMALTRRLIPTTS